MGLSASAYNLMRYTQRKNDIGRQLSQFSLQKMSLTRDVQNLTREYQNAMNKKVFKWTNNAGASYSDLSYSTLMTPNSMNFSTLNMLTDVNGRVVVDKKYRRYAEMISPNGAPNGDYESNRSAIIADLLGLNPGDIEMAEAAYHSILDSQYELESLHKPAKNDYRFYKTNMNKLLTDKLSGYDKNAEITSVSQLTSFINGMKSSLGRYFLDDQSDFEGQCDTQLTLQTELLNNVLAEEDESKRNYPTQGEVANAIIGCYNCWYDIDDESYAQYQNDLSQWETESSAAEANKNAAYAVYNSVFDSNKRSEADFYDALFSSIAENGWEFYEKVNDPEFLNNTLQNGYFNITNVERICIRENNGYTYENSYVTDPASTCKNLIQINDADNNNKMYIEYERKKTLLNEKETRIDLRMENLKTEQAAIKQMIESVNNVMKNNIEQHFNIFNA